MTMRVYWFGTLSLVLSFSVGCSRSDSAPPANSPAAAEQSAADHHVVAITEADVQMPANYTDALARIEGYRDKIRTEASGDVPERAHRALDELDIVLDKLTGIARDSGVPKEQWEEVNTGSHELRDLFNKVHADIDAGKKPDYSAVAEDIEKTIDRLRAISSARTPGAPSNEESTP